MAIRGRHASHADRTIKLWISRATGVSDLSISNRLAQNLTYASLISIRFRRSVERVEVEFDSVMIDEKYGMVSPHPPVLDHDHVEIVEHEPVSIEASRHHGVVFVPDVILQDDDPKVIRGNPRFLQSNELSDGVVFAVPSAHSERGQGRNSRHHPRRKAPDRSSALSSD